MSHPSSTITVVAGLIQQHGQLLICQRRHDGEPELRGPEAKANLTDRT